MNNEAIFALCGLVASSAALGLLLYFHRYTNPKKALKNKYGIPFKFEYHIGDYYKLKLYDSEFKKWVYVVEVSINLSNRHDTCGYEPCVARKTFRPHLLDKSIVDRYTSIDMLISENLAVYEKVMDLHEMWQANVYEADKKLNSLIK